MDPSKGDSGKRGAVNLDNIVQVINGMYAVVNEGGTGVRARIPGLEICGKTGTAQLASNDMLKGTALGRSMKDNAWFVGFAPRQSPEIVVVALFEGGEHGPMAAPIVSDVIKAYFDKRLRTSPQQLLAELPMFGPQNTARTSVPVQTPEPLVAKIPITPAASQVGHSSAQPAPIRVSTEEQQQ
jgi:penicillin-binding protein 2